MLIGILMEIARPGDEYNKFALAESIVELHNLMRRMRLGPRVKNYNEIIDASLGIIDCFVNPDSTYLDSATAVVWNQLVEYQTCALAAVALIRAATKQ
ncbi:MAG TPA: hypothetical protein EYP98_03965 [Planctomycetes bacterium]|nr:hypothetical protein [Planctomycetota bacterium]